MNASSSGGRPGALHRPLDRHVSRARRRSNEPCPGHRRRDGGKRGARRRSNRRRLWVNLLHDLEGGTSMRSRPAEICAFLLAPRFSAISAHPDVQQARIDLGQFACPRPPPRSTLRRKAGSGQRIDEPGKSLARSPLESSSSLRMFGSTESCRRVALTMPTALSITSQTPGTARGDPMT